MLNLYVVYLKLIQHCKSSLLKKKEKGDDGSVLF